jgi:RNA 2',3'-cyclic 3'-phosphodiesterase
MTSRLFISLDIPENNLEKLLRQRDEIYGLPNDVKWENKDKLHITLKFLGDVGENITELMIRRFEELEFNRIRAKFDKFSFFKNNGSLKILFAGFQENQAIIEFQEIIKKECELLGFESVNKKFHPHVTLLRIKDKENISRLVNFNNYAIEGDEFIIKKFSIVKSELKPSGSEYNIVKSFKLI